MFLTFISYIRDFIKFDSSSAYESTFDKRYRKISLVFLDRAIFVLITTQTVISEYASASFFTLQYKYV